MPSDDEKPGARQAEAGRAAKLPGLRQSAAIAALSAILVGYGMRPRPDTPDAAAASLLTEVAPDDMPAAIDTVDATRDQLARFRDRRSCGNRLAFVTLMHAPDQPDGRIRLRSGNYISPAFEVTEAPVRAALPYPAPYETGQGIIAVLGATTNTVVALRPAWPVSAKEPPRSRMVRWQPSGDCPRRGG